MDKKLRRGILLLIAGALFAYAAITAERPAETNTEAPPVSDAGQR